MNSQTPQSSLWISWKGFGAFLSMLGLIYVQELPAATLIWDSNTGVMGAQDGSGGWADQSGSNWLNGTTNVPWDNANGDTAAFGDGVTTPGAAATVTVSGGVTVGGITFNAPAAANTLYTLTGGTITLNNGAIIANNATNNSALHTISSALYTTGTVTLAGRRMWMNNSSFAGGGILNINTQDQALFEHGGSLTGLSVINLNSGGIDIRGSTGGGYNYANGTVLNVNADLALNTNSIGTAGTVVDWQGQIVVNSAKTLSLTPQSSNTSLRISGSISESGGVGKVRINGTAASNNTAVILAATNSYTGTTQVSSGILQVGIGGVGTTGTGAVTVENSNSILSGSGTVRGATTISSGGTLKPGDSAGASIGTLTFSNATTSSLILSAGSTTLLTIGGATGNEANPMDGIQTSTFLNGTPGNHDHLDISGSLALNAGSTINVSLLTGFNPVWGDVYNLVDWGTVSGSLIPNSFNVNTDLVLETSAQMITNGWSWDRSQFLSHGIVFVVPEPGRALLMMLALSFAFLRRRR